MIRNFWNFHRKTESSAQVRNLGQQFWQWKVPSLLVARQTWEIRWICQIFPIIPLDRRIFQHWNECLEDHWDGYCEWFSVVASAWVSGRVFQRAWFRVSDLDVPLSASQTSTWYIFNTFRAQRHPATATATWNTAPLGPDNVRWANHAVLSGSFCSTHPNHHNLGTQGQPAWRQVTCRTKGSSILNPWLNFSSWKTNAFTRPVLKNSPLTHFDTKGLQVGCQQLMR